MTAVTLTLRDVCDAMYRLNAVAKMPPLDLARRQIYALKGRLIKHLYQGGYAAAVALETQPLACWKCRGSNLDPVTDEPPCPHCVGGIHHEYQLYAFCFVVGGRWYQWHQPAELVDYPVTLTDRGTLVYAPSRWLPVTERDRAAWHADAVLVKKYLNAQGG